MTLFYRKIFVLFFTFGAVLGGQGQEKSASLGGAAYQEKYQHRIRRTPIPIKIDGELSDEAWQTATVSKNFAPHWPQDNVPLKRDTEVKMAFDDRFLYVGVVCRDSNQHIIQTLKRDASFWDSDAFGLILDPINERTNGFFFGVNAANAQWEGLLTFFSDELNGSWDNKWYSQTKIYDTFWTIEMAIPFKTLRYDPSKTQWGINFERNDLKNNQYSTWTFVPVNFNGYDLGYTGALVWEDTPPTVKGNVSLVPYITGGVSHDHIEGKLTKGSFNGGLDAKIAINSSLNLDVTLNPDFSQIEVDRQVTNLTRFSIFFPERRTFFLENDDLFSSYGAPPFRPFFSRAVGLDRNAQPIRIIGGVRLSGNLDKNWRVGLMTMQTASKDSLTPAQNFTAFSFNRKVLKRSLIKGYALNRQGFMTEAARKANPINEYGRNQGLEFSYSNVKGDLSAWAGYHLSQKSTIKKNSDVKQAGFGYFGRNLNFFVDYIGIGTNYYADMGFLNRVDNFTFRLDQFGKIQSDTTIRLGYKQIYSEAEYTIRPKKGKISSHSLGTENFLLLYPNGELGEYSTAFGYNVLFQNTSSFSLRYDHNRVNVLFPFVFTDSDYALPANNYTYSQYSATYGSDYRKKFYYTVSFRTGGFYNGTLQQYALEMNYRAQPWGNFSMSFEQNDITLPRPYGNDRLLLVSPRVEINFSTQLFWTTFLQFNTQNNNFNVNSRVQWRYKPMSDFFLVYTDNYYTDPLFRNKNRAIVFKFNYWLTL
ncbi:MAG: DUF5916 domain-containing protein [Runella zeae]